MQDPRRFAGKEWDAESHLNYFGTRYFAANLGRFTSPDPIVADEVRLVNPQRWNQYAYALNSPFRAVDPDGRDVLVINYRAGAHGAGHIALVAIHQSDGQAFYGGFNPEHGGSMRDRGHVVAPQFGPGTIQFGPDGRPTNASIARLVARAATLDNQDPSSAKTAYFKTSDAETVALINYIDRASLAPPGYNVLLCNCLSFVAGGLGAAAIADVPDTTVGYAPNIFFDRFIAPLAWWDSVRDRLFPPHGTVSAEAISFCVAGGPECGSGP